ncbi:hypothetical protein AAF712_001751 [Marasmius tenuissimus]|uniref:Polycomb protein VEFS-Box domain-containing protein n=1 Tax=Marasmius tenuissimus TaxID=585030 RepID=A0ABR3AF38_9AGAR
MDESRARDNPPRNAYIASKSVLAPSGGPSREAKRFKGDDGALLPRQRTLSRKSIKPARKTITTPRLSSSDNEFDAQRRNSQVRMKTVQRKSAAPRRDTTTAQLMPGFTVLSQPPTSGSQTPHRTFHRGHKQLVTKSVKSVHQTPLGKTSRRIPSRMVAQNPVDQRPSPRFPVKTLPKLQNRDWPGYDSDEDGVAPRRRVPTASATTTQRYHTTHADSVPELSAYLDPDHGLVSHEMDVDEYDPPNSQPRPLQKYARKTSVPEPPESDSDSEFPVHDDSDDSDTDGSEIQVIEPPILLTNTTSSKVKVDEGPTRALVNSLKECVSWLPKGRLPFLQRNLYVGFRSHCRARGVYLDSEDENVVVQLEATYIYEANGGPASFTTPLAPSSWTCPLCLLHRKFSNRYVLQKHLEWDHHEVQVRWVRGTSDMMTGWTVELTLPLPSAPTTDAQVHPHLQYTTYEEENYPNVPWKFEELSNDLKAYEREWGQDKGKGKAREVSSTPTLSREEISTRDSSILTTTISYRNAASTRDESSALTSSVASTAEPSTSASTLPIHVKKARSISPPITLTARDEEEVEVDPLGPTAKYPFLPVQSDDGKIVIRYSCRIGGPKIYDLLGTLPMDQFGVLAWAVLDREEEIFEVDDIRDECKVMHALWARWIFLNRNVFIRNYVEGVQSFIDEYWKIIQRAAGWEALRYWLLLLLPTRFLTGHDVAQLLKYYEEKVGVR